MEEIVDRLIDSKRLRDPYNLYKGRYKDFIESILDERPVNEWFEYSEYHHVIPFCCDGTDNDEDNLRLYLNLNEHFIAHKILAEDNPGLPGLVYAYWRMCNGKEDCTPEDYEIGKRLFIENNPMKDPEAIKRYSDSRRGKELSESPRKSISDSKKVAYVGEGNPFYGKHHSEQTKQRISDTLTGHTDSEETRLKKSESLTGRVLTETHKSNLSNALKGKRNALGTKYPKRKFHVMCKVCGNQFIGNSPSHSICDNCRKESI